MEVQFLFYSVLFIVEALAAGLGKCPRYGYIQDFNMTKFTGEWYEVERSFHLMELMSNCVTISLEENAKKQLDVTVRTVGKWSGSVKESEGTAIISKRDPSVFTYRVHTKLPSAVARYLPGSGFYQILDTDYNNYAILWSCSSMNVIHLDNVWILGRRRDLDVNLRKKIYDFLSSRKIDTDRLIASNNNCAI